MYAKFWKRMMDFTLALTALTVLLPVLLVLTAVGAVQMKGNPFFTQLRPGKHEKPFRLIKFRSMTSEKDQNGQLLPDELRLTRYGKALRATSLDELPELINILKGDMALVGPRPLLMKYLPLYNAEQKRRHNVRPGLTGYAQVHGRNTVSWEERFAMDVWYTEHITFSGDMKILLDTVRCVLRRDGITAVDDATMPAFTGTAVSAKADEAAGKE